MNYILIVISMGIGSFLGYFMARRWFLDNYSQKMQDWSDKMTKLSKRVSDTVDSYEQKKKELEDKYKDGAAK